MDPLVSIVIPTYNSASLICETVQSCLEQTYPHCEIIIVDDGSTDDTERRLQETFGDRIRYIRQQNSGASAARNRGITEATGDFIKFCDADDKLFPQHIARCVEKFAQSDASVGVVYTRYQHVDLQGIPIKEMTDPPLLEGNVFCDILLSNSNAILTSATMVRKSALLDVGFFRVDSELRNSEDWDLYLRLATKYQYAAVDEILLDYRWHEGGLTANRYYTALGRLVAVQYARDYLGRDRCLNDADYDRLESSRYHVMAFTCWELGKRQEAQAYFRKSFDLNPKLIAIGFYLLSFIAPASVGNWVSRILGSLKQGSLLH